MGKFCADFATKGAGILLSRRTFVTVCVSSLSVCLSVLGNFFFFFFKHKILINIILDWVCQIDGVGKGLWAL